MNGEEAGKMQTAFAQIGSEQEQAWGSASEATQVLISPKNIAMATESSVWSLLTLLIGCGIT